jgi:hypothetical protein
MLNREFDKTGAEGKGHAANVVLHLVKVHRASEEEEKS